MTVRALVETGFYEWRTIGGTMVPFSIGMKHGRSEGWQDPSTSEWLRTFTTITEDLNDLVAKIHIRRPIILPEERHAKWLGEAEDGDLT